MRWRPVLYAACGIGVLLAAGGIWLGSKPPRTQVATAPRALPAVRERRARPVPIAAPKARAQREDGIEPPPREGASVASDAQVAEGPPPEPAPEAPALHVPEKSAPDETAAEYRPESPHDPAWREATPEPVAPAPARPREVALTRLRLWSQPGMCPPSAEGLSAREALRLRFRSWDGGDRGQFYVDPRLPLEALTPILDALADAEREVASRLKLSVSRPEAFLYLGKQLLTAAACINDDVVAYYDGALHVAADDADLRASVLHEYTHHALISSGMLGPAWAQEGIAMNIAGESWWRQRRWYRALLDRPFGIDDMDESIPYKLVPAQALLFYAQSAALVACLLETKHWELDALFQALRPGSGEAGETLVYELPEVEQALFLRRCLEHWDR